MIDSSQNIDTIGLIENQQDTAADTDQEFSGPEDDNQLELDDDAYKAECSKRDNNRKNAKEKPKQDYETEKVYIMYCICISLAYLMDHKTSLTD